MSNKKISQLNLNTTPSSSDVIPIVNNNETKKITLNGLKDFINCNKQSDWNQTDNTSIDFIKNKPNVFQEVSATQKGIVNNIALQELGGVDKLINGVRIGCGEGNKSNNLVVGRNALAANTTGTNNIAIGDYSLWSNTTGIWNTVFGSSSMVYNTTGQYNVAVGTALYHNKTGSRNVGIGIRAGYANESGSYNTFVGDGAGYEGGVGSYNVALGRLSMIITGSGYISGGSTINRNRNVVIGANIIVPDGVNDTLAVDNKGTTTTSYSTALLYGGFSDTNRFLNIGGKLSITPTYMPNATGDSTYTKNIVAKPDGTFGWEDKVNFSKGTTFPITPNAGDLFFNTTDNKHYGYNGTIWNTLY